MTDLEFDLKLMIFREFTLIWSLFLLSRLHPTRPIIALALHSYFSFFSIVMSNFGDHSLELNQTKPHLPHTHAKNL